MKFIYLIQHFKTLCLLALLIPFSSCEKFIDIDPPETEIETTTLFSSDNAAVSAVVGLYSRMGQTDLTITNGGASIYPGLSSDEIYNTSANAELDAFSKNALVADNGTGNYSRLWRAAYQHIYHCNSILEGLGNSTTLTDSIRNQLRGEILVARSLHYFYLVSLYGDVPLELETDYKENSILPRTDKNIVFQQLVQDLIEAKNLLKTGYVSNYRSRPNQWTAVALLAKIYLHMGDWANAEIQSGAVISSGQYSLHNNISTVFNTLNSNETIWQLVRDNNNTSEGNAFNPSSATSKPTYALTTQLMNAFTTGDLRKTNWIKKNTVGGVDYNYPYKYRLRNIPSGSTPSEYYIVFRLADQYLIRAEARARQNKITEARSDLNMTRARAGLANSTTTDQTILITEIEKERQLELFCEWGNRWLDLKRTNKAGAVLGILKAPGWQSFDVLYPIPLSEMQRNPNMVQNPGY